MAVYTEITDEEVAAFAAEYGVGHVIACKGIAEGIENSNYLLVAERGNFILTLYERRVKTADLPFFLDLMEHLATRGIPCPVPVRARGGAALRSLAGKPAAMVTFLSGMWPRRPTAHHCESVGRAMARLHLAGSDFVQRRNNDLSVSSWRALLEATAGAQDTVSEDLMAELRDDLAVLERDWPTSLPSGVIHADLFPDNVFFEGQNLSGLIDFYFACTDMLAYDIAIALNAWCFEPDGSFNTTKARRLVAGYEQVRPLSQPERDALPVLARGAAMRFLATRLYDWVHTPEGALVTRKNPAEYIQKLRFHRRIRHIGGYGLDDS